MPAPSFPEPRSSMYFASALYCAKLYYFYFYYRISIIRVTPSFPCGPTLLAPLTCLA